MNKEEPKVLTRMRLSCCWGDNLNEKELNEVVDYINLLQRKVNQLETNNDTAINFIDQVLQYHITPFQPNELDEDINTLIGILRSGSNE